MIEIRMGQEVLNRQDRLLQLVVVHYREDM